MRRRTTNAGFTLVEILIVVVILGILAAIVVPQYLGATQDATEKTAFHEMKRLRKAVEVYLIRHGNGLPDVEEGDRTWGSLIAVGDYLKNAPVNPYVGGENAGYIVLGDSPDEAYQTDYGWIYNPDTGDIWAGGFDANDNPYPKN
ncbi:MAG: type II secretion system protein [Planctomycetota bacterium]|nr:type II secretion system protein [Planctomycetota bacterium]